MAGLGDTQLLSPVLHLHLVGVAIATRRTFEASNAIAEACASPGHVTVSRETFDLKIPAGKSILN
jgi:hypothetical protein